MCAKSIESFGGATNIESISEEAAKRIQEALYSGDIASLSSEEREILEVFLANTCEPGVWGGDIMVGL